jgi:hypothetical protein
MNDAPSKSSIRPKARTTMIEYGMGRKRISDAIKAIPPTRTTIPTTRAATAPVLVDLCVTTVSLRWDDGAAATTVAGTVAGTTVAGTALVVNTVAVPAAGSA